MVCKDCKTCDCQVKVWTNGCFDIFHMGHLRMLEFARAQGDYLIVGLDEDEKIRYDKGQYRPIFPLEHRMAFLNALECVDEVTSFSSRENLAHTVSRVQPDIMVVGSDYRDREVVGSQYAGKVVYFDRIAGYSTTKVIDKVKIMVEQEYYNKLRRH